MLWLNFFLNRLCRCLHLRAYLALLCASTREHIILGAWQQPGPRHFVPRTEAIPPGTGKHSATRFLFSGSPRRPEPRAGGPICLSCRTPPRRMNLYPVSRAFTAATESAPEAPWRRRVFAKQRKIPLRSAGSDLTLPRRRAWCPAFNHPWSGARRSPRRRGCAEIAPPGLPDVTRFSPLQGSNILQQDSTLACLQGTQQRENTLPVLGRQGACNAAGSKGPTSIMHGDPRLTFFSYLGNWAVVKIQLWKAMCAQSRHCSWKGRFNPGWRPEDIANPPFPIDINTATNRQP